MKSLLIVAHAPSMRTQSLLASLHAGAQQEAHDQGVNVHSTPALQTQPEQVLAADAMALLTPENLGYMSGGMKDFFDRIYYPCLDAKQGLPVVAVVRAGHDGTGTSRALQSITTGLRWRWVQPVVVCQGAWHDGFSEQCFDLGAALAAGLAMGMY